jgi:hypothetical protein
MSVEHEQFDAHVELKVAASAANEMESAMICGLLSDAGIRSLTRPGTGSGALGWTADGRRRIYVREADLERAREVLRDV